jgi:uncharacterized tellurite resistance protein B-like protein
MTSRHGALLPLSLQHPASLRAMFDDLTNSNRMRLMKFVCSFAWADLTITPEERAFIAQLIRGLELSREEEVQVHSWLDAPPALEGLDPTTIPKQHRRFFLEAVEGVLSADGEMSPEEQESLAVFGALLA